jgi:hypothetical protein
MREIKLVGVVNSAPPLDAPTSALTFCVCFRSRHFRTVSRVVDRKLISQGPLVNCAVQGLLGNRVIVVAKIM